jgi:DivIVA domain-containing protein
MGPVTIFFVFLVIVVIGVTFFIGTDLASRIFRNRNLAVGDEIPDGLDEPVAALPPVLLPADPKPSDIDRVRFALGLRGYRMDQVDQVLDELRDQLAEKDREIARLKAALPASQSAHEPAPEEGP